jgi:hypothetical protein
MVAYPRMKADANVMAAAAEEARSDIEGDIKMSVLLVVSRACAVADCWDG